MARQSYNCVLMNECPQEDIPNEFYAYVLSFSIFFLEQFF